VKKRGPRLSSHFDRLDEKNGREEAGEQRREPLLHFEVAELDATHDDEEHRHTGDDQ
jgi:hypothetical protein